MTRKHTDLPKGTKRDGDWWIYRPYLGIENGKQLYGPKTRLCRISEPRRVVAALARKIAQERLQELSGAFMKERTVEWLLDYYLESPHCLSEIAPSTNAHFHMMKDEFCREVIDGVRRGDIPLRYINKQAIRRYLDQNLHRPTAAKHRIQLLKAAWNYASERVTGLPANPCLQIKLPKYTPRERYVTDEEYQRLFDIASPSVRVAMELAYLCRARLSEVLSLRYDDIHNGHLYVARGKGSDDEWCLITPRLQAAIDASKELPSKTSSKAYIARGTNGGKQSVTGFKSIWQRLLKKGEELGYERFTFHDLKAKGYSDMTNQYAGHRSASMHRVYSRNARPVVPPNGGLNPSVPVQSLEGNE